MMPVISASSELRLDLYLIRCRLIKRRTAAQAACAAGLITVNGAPARPGKKIRVGDQLTLRHGGRLLELGIVSIPKKGDRSVLAGNLPYEIISSKPLPREKELEVFFHFEDQES